MKGEHARMHGRESSGTVGMEEGKRTCLRFGAEMVCQDKVTTENVGLTDI